MDKNEVITLSSDEEVDCENRSKSSKKSCVVKNQSSDTPKVAGSQSSITGKLENLINGCRRSVVCISKRKASINYSKADKKEAKRMLEVVEIDHSSIKHPEVVDLEGSSDEMSQNSFSIAQQTGFTTCNNRQPHSENPSKPESIETQRNYKCDDSLLIKETERIVNEKCKPKILEVIANENAMRNEDDISDTSTVSRLKPDKTSSKESSHTEVSDVFENETSVKTNSDELSSVSENFNEFVNLCGCFEDIESDRMRLINKLIKRHKEADPEYVSSLEFTNFIEKCRSRINKNNLYLIAKEVTDDLSSRKKIEIPVGKPNSKNNEANQRQEDEEDVKAQKEWDKRSKKQKKIINKIINRLDKLGLKIRELEEAEVDLSDEEESSYLLLQRYRERYCQIYTKLCEYTNEIADANRVYCRKICFSGSKYPSINKCIEKWLNKTKRFPDFTDIMTLLESQSSSLGLPSNKEHIRSIAIEIFQKVGVMLQQRRKYDLWDSFCGFLDESEDPANNNPELDKVLKENFETRVKKEQEIFRYYAEKQENERLEALEVPEDEANMSPNESGNEDEKEIEDIEKCLSERLDVVIEKQNLDDSKENDFSRSGNWDGGGNCSDGTADTRSHWNENSNKDTSIVKETKNNYKNCKSLKWRSGDKEKSVTGDVNDKAQSSIFSEDQKCTENEENESKDKQAEEEKTNKKAKEQSVESEEDVECICLDSEPIKTRNELMDNLKLIKPSKVEVKRLDLGTIGNLRNEFNRQIMKRGPVCENESPAKKKKMFNPSDKTENEREKDFEILDDFENENMGRYDGKNIFEVRHCQIEHNFESIFGKLGLDDDMNEKGPEWGKREIFRDLTNVGRLMEMHRKEAKALGLFSRSFCRRNFHDFEKLSWKKRFKVNCKFAGLKSEKCALSYDENTGTSLNGEERNSEENDVQDNSESGGDEGSNFFGGRGSGSEEDNNENDENENNGKAEDDMEETKHEEEEEEKDEDSEDEYGEKDKKSKRENDVCDKNNTTEGEVNYENGTKNSGSDLDSNFMSGKLSEDERTTEEDEITNEKNEEKAEIENREENFENLKVAVLGETEENNSDSDVKNEEESCKRLEVGKEEEAPSALSIRESCENPDKNNIECSNENNVECSNENNVECSDETPVMKEKEFIVQDDGNEICLEEERSEDNNEIGREIENKEKEEHQGNGEDDKSEGNNHEECQIEINEVFDEKTAIKENLEKTVQIEDTEVMIEQNQVSVVSEKESCSEDESEEKYLKMETEDTSITNEREVECEYSDQSEESTKTDFHKEMNNIDVPKAQKKVVDIEFLRQSMRSRNNVSASDEERVKQFLLHSPSSISITPPKKMTRSKQPSQEALKALETLRGLKGISTTRVVTKPKTEDDVVVIGESYRTQGDTCAASSASTPKRRRSELPVISNIQSIPLITPKIVTVQGNVSGFENVNDSWFVQMNNGEAAPDSSSLRISNVWGNLPNDFIQCMQNNESIIPSSSFYQSNLLLPPPPQPPTPSSTVAKKKNAKKTVEYVVLD